MPKVKEPAAEPAPWVPVSRGPTSITPAEPGRFSFSVQLTGTVLPEWVQYFGRLTSGKGPQTDFHTDGRMVTGECDEHKAEETVKTRLDLLIADANQAMEYNVVPQLMQEHQQKVDARQARVEAAARADKLQRRLNTP